LNLGIALRGSPAAHSSRLRLSVIPHRETIPWNDEARQFGVTVDHGYAGHMSCAATELTE
jgi:hypothetical protein